MKRTIDDIIELHNRKTCSYFDGVCTCGRYLTISEIQNNKSIANNELNNKTKEELLEFIKNKFFNLE